MAAGRAAAIREAALGDDFFDILALFDEVEEERKERYLARRMCDPANLPHVTHRVTTAPPPQLGPYDAIDPDDEEISKCECNHCLALDIEYSKRLLILFILLA